VGSTRVEKNVFGLAKLIPFSESACKECDSMDFIAARQEYNETYDLMQLFRMTDSETERNAEPKLSL
jgi:hypothetical protein